MEEQRKRLYTAPYSPTTMGEITTIGVLGAGLMGSGIATVCSLEHEVLVYDLLHPLRAGKKKIEESLERMAKGTKITEEQRVKALSQLGYVGMENPAGETRQALKLADFKRCEVIIEAVTESFEVKKGLINEITRIGYKGILVSNTSSIPITKLAAEFLYPAQFAGMHFMNPVPVQPIVEVICGLSTSEETMETVEGLVRTLGKTPLRVQKDQAGFYVNKIFVPYLNAAAREVERGVVSVEDADKVKDCLGHKMGPLMTLDFVGIDTTVFICEELAEECGPEYKPTPLLLRMKETGWLGMKSGTGFYVHEKGKAPVPNPKLLT